MDPESEQLILEITIPGRYVVYPANVSVEQAEKVLLSPCTIETSYCGHAQLLMIGQPYQHINNEEENIITNPYNQRFVCPDLGNGVGFGICYSIEPEHLKYMENTFHMLKNWFTNYANELEPKFIDIRAEIKTYIEQDYTIWPMPTGFVEWFIANKVGGFKIKLIIPFDIENNTISGGCGSITYDFSDLWKLADFRMDSDYIYEYAECRQKVEDEKREKRETQKISSQLINSLAEMKDKRIQVNRDVIEIFIGNISSRLIIEMAYDGNLYTVSLQDHLNQSLVMAEQAMISNEPLSVYHGITNATVQAQNQLRRLEWKEVGHSIRNSRIGSKETRQQIKAYTILAEFWSLIGKEYTSALQEIKKSDSKADSLTPPPPANQSLTPDEMREVVREILAPLGGCNLQNERIMSITDFNRLIDYTDYLVVNNVPPSDVKVIPQTQVAGRHITFTFRRLHERLFTTKSIRDSFVLFLMECFHEFNDREFGSFKTEFSKKPLKSYYADLGLKKPE